MKLFIRTHQILGTQPIIYTAWEPATPEHKETSFSQGHEFGRVGSKEPELCTTDYPLYTEKRLDALVKLFKVEWNKAYKVIYEQHPELRDQVIIETCGQIEVWSTPPGTGHVFDQGGQHA